MEQLDTVTYQPAAPATNLDLIDQLPTTELDLLKQPEQHQRQLFDAFQLELRYHRNHHRLTLRATLRADTIRALQHAIGTTTATSSPQDSHRADTTTGAGAPAPAPVSFSHVRRAPG